mmetsp:Transcript_9142/g.28974  ORF Transcript_9142/g.28974 Transcript_9142/m.28974 type:complete len:92 (+) Transcript_9142:1095-1370(+)
MTSAGLCKLSSNAVEGTCVKDDGSGDVDELDHIYAGACGSRGLELAGWKAAPALRLPTSDIGKMEGPSLSCCAARYDCDSVSDLNSINFRS